MKIKNVEGLNAYQLQKEADQGARFVHYAFTISFIFFSVRRESGVYLLRTTDNAILKSMPYTFATLLLGWWGIPFGPKYALQSLRTNLRGGKDVTEEVMSTVAGFILFEETEKRKAV